MIRTTLHGKDKGEEFSFNLKLEFNGHLDDKKALRKAVMAELKVKKPNIMHCVQRIEIRKD